MTRCGGPDVPRTCSQNGGQHMQDPPYAAELGRRCSPRMSQQAGVGPS